MKQLIPAVLFTLLSLSLPAQDIHFSQFFNSPLTLSPAQTGDFVGTFRFGAIYRSQYASVPSPYKTLSLFYDHVFEGLQEGDAVSVGANIYADRAGRNNLATTWLSLTGAYHKALSSNTRITVGLQVGSIQKKLDDKRLVFGDMLTFDPTPLPTKDPFIQNGGNFKVSGFNLNAGLQAATQVADIPVHLGATVFNILRPNEDFVPGGRAEDEQLPIRVDVYTGASIPLNEKFTLYPRVLYQTQKKAQEILVGGDVGIRVDNPPFRTWYFGTWTRVTGIDAQILYAAVDYKKWKFGLSYDVNLSSLRHASGGRGAFEVSLIYIGVIPKQRLDVVVPCLRF